MTPVDPVFKVLAAMRDQADRLMAADRLDELGRPESARLLRDPDMPPLVLYGAVLLGVRAESPNHRGEYPIHFFNPDGDGPAAYLPAPRRGPPPVPEVVRLRDKVFSFYRRWQWCDFYAHNPARRRSPEYEPCLPDRNNFWVLPLTRCDERAFRAAVKAGQAGPPSRTSRKR
jgi:hypothetical protein